MRCSEVQQNEVAAIEGARPCAPEAGLTCGLSVTSTYTLLEEASGHASVRVRENILNSDHSEGRARKQTTHV